MRKVLRRMHRCVAFSRRGGPGVSAICNWVARDMRAWRPDMPDGVAHVALVHQRWGECSASGQSTSSQRSQPPLPSRRPHCASGRSTRTVRGNLQKVQLLPALHIPQGALRAVRRRRRGAAISVALCTSCKNIKTRPGQRRDPPFHGVHDGVWELVDERGSGRTLVMEIRKCPTSPVSGWLEPARRDSRHEPEHGG